MQSILSLLFLLGFCHGEVTRLRIIGGETIQNFSMYNYLGFVNTYDPDSNLIRAVCGGSVIDANYILTSAHCFFPPGVAKQSNFSLISLGSKFQEFDFPVDRVEVQGYPIMHPEYKRRGLKNDLALIKLDNPIDFVKYKQVGKTDVASELDEPIVDTCFVLGWGANGTGNLSDIFDIAVFPILTTDLCKSNSAKFNETSTYCAGPKPTDPKPGSPNTCKGDSGGPLMCLSKRGQNIGTIKQFGVISYGKGICDAKRFRPTFFPKLPFYEKWITSVIKNGH